MATLTIKLSPETANRLAREARRRGVDVETYVRHLLGDEETDKILSLTAEEDTQGEPPASTLTAEDSIVSSTEAVVAAIKATGHSRVPMQEATADLAALLLDTGIDQGISPAEWDRQWSDYEARQKALDMASTEKALRETRDLLGDEER